MLNPFPIQFLSLLAHAILRLFVGGTLIYLGSSRLKNKGHDRTAIIIAITELVSGTMLLFGFYTQFAALATLLISTTAFLVPSFREPKRDRLFYALLFGAALSLFITGAGAFAFDLPI